MDYNPHPDLTRSVIFGLGWAYLALALMNAFWTVRSAKKDGHLQSLDRLGFGHIPVAAAWAVYSALLFALAIVHLVTASNPETFAVRMPEAFKNFADYYFADPKIFFALSILVLVAMIWLRRWWTRDNVAWALLNVAMVFTTLSVTDFDFRQIVGKPDNVPIVGMLFIVAFFTWVYFKRSVDNDDRIARGEPLREQQGANEKILVWPDLVYTELICMVVLTVILVVWGIVLQAPLEEPANAAKTPNPSKAPWYFLGLQEMLVYYDPWLAGVVFPSLILVGLMAIPYIDFNTKGNGYYTFNERKFSVSVFLFGFIPLWIAMIILGTFLRGPNWNFFGIYEYWDVHKLEALTNVNLSEYFWLYWLGRDEGMPSSILVREAPGILVTLGYFIILPPLMAATVFRKFYARMGFVRFMVFAMLVLTMAALPLKMLLRWTMNLKYIVAIPEWFFNI